MTAIHGQSTTYQTNRLSHVFDSPNSQLRILHIAPSVAPSYGGPATVVTHLAAAQALLGHDVSIISNLDPNQRPGYLDATRCIPGYDEVNAHLYPWCTHFTRWFGTRLLPVYADLFPDADVIHLHGIWEPMLVTAAALARRMDLPYIVRPCGMLDPWCLQQRSFKKQLAMRLSHKSMLDHAACIHTLSTEESRLIMPLNIRSPHIIIPNGVSLEEIDDISSDEFFQQFPQLQFHPYILFLSRLHSKKGLDLLAEAFVELAPRLPDVHLLVIGPESKGINDSGNSRWDMVGGGAKKQFLDIISRHGLQNRVHVPGPLIGSAKFAAYRHASCFCLPSRQEGFSNAIVEALASGLPTAISTECHFSEVETIGAGKVFPLHVPDIAEALHSLLTMSASQRQAMSLAARNHVEQHLTWERIAHQTLDVYNLITQRK